MVWPPERIASRGQPFTHRDDAETVGPIAARLRADGLTVSDSEGAALRDVSERLADSRALILFLSHSTSHAARVRLTAEALRFRDHRNEDLVFVPVRLDDAPLPAALSSVFYLDWSNDPERAYASLLDTCRSRSERQRTLPQRSVSHVDGLDSAVSKGVR